MTGYDVMLYNLDLQGRSERLGRLLPQELRRRGVEAARDQDLEALWALVEAYLVLRGTRGARVSQHTLATYRIGLKTFLKHSAQAGVGLLQPRPNEGFAYVRWLETQGLSPASVKNRLASARDRKSVV